MKHAPVGFNALTMKKVSRRFFSVVILNHNGGDFLYRCVASVARTDYPVFEIILVDNASSDGSIELVRERLPEVSLSVFDLPMNRGFCGGNNYGAQFARGDYIVFLNNDTEVRSDWLLEIARVIEANPDVGIIQPAILRLDDRQTIESAGVFIDQLGFVYIRGAGETYREGQGEPRRVFIAMGAALVVEADLFRCLGGFDETFFAIAEDGDICWRAWLSGSYVLYVPSSVVYHKGRHALKKMPDQNRAYLTSRNWTMALVKNSSLETLALRLPLRVCLTLLASILSFDVSILVGTAMGMVRVALNLRQVMSKRAAIQSSAKTDERSLRRSQLILPFNLPRLLQKACGAYSKRKTRRSQKRQA